MYIWLILGNVNSLAISVLNISDGQSSSAKIHKHDGIVSEGVKAEPESSQTGHYYNCIGLSANTAEELGQKINDKLGQAGSLNIASMELIDINYRATRLNDHALIFTAQIIIRTQQRITV